MVFWALKYFLVYILLFQGRIRPKGYTYAHITLTSSNIAIVTADDSNGTTVKQNDISKYLKEYDTSQLTYKFKDDSKCTELKYSEGTVWKHDSTKDKSDYPVEISVNFFTSNFRIKTKKKLYIYAYRNSKWDLTFESEVKSLPPISSLAPQEAYKSQNDKLDFYYFQPNDIASLARKLSKLGIQIITIDDHFHFQTNNLSNFRIYQDGYTTVCEVINLSKFCEVKYKDEVIWQNEALQQIPNYLSSAFFYFKSGTLKFDFTPKRFFTVIGSRFNIYLDFYMKHFCNESPSPLERVKGKELILKVLTLKSSNSDSETSESYSDSSDSQTESSSTQSQDASSNETAISSQPDESAADTSGKATEVEHELRLAQDTPGVKRHTFSENDRLVRVIAEGQSVWTHDSTIDGCNYPTEISLHIWERQYFLIKTLNRIYCYTYLHNKCVLTVLYISEDPLGSELATVIEKKVKHNSESTVDHTAPDSSAPATEGPTQNDSMTIESPTQNEQTPTANPSGAESEPTIKAPTESESPPITHNSPENQPPPALVSSIYP